MAVLLLVSFFFDYLFLQIQPHSITLTGFFQFISDSGLILILTTVTTLLIFHRNHHLLPIFAISLAIAFELAYLGKVLFQIPRPEGLVLAEGYSFPSIHTALCIAIIPFLHFLKTRKIFKILLIVSLFLIIYSRLYLGVHTLSDLLAGGIIGYISAKSIFYLEKNHHLTDWLFFHIKDKLEMRRQIAHLLIGLSVVLLVHYGLINSGVIFAMLVFGAIVVILQKKYHLPITTYLLQTFERPHDLEKFPGKGAFFLLFGAFVALELFPQNIALAAITIMAIGDSVSHLIGRYVGRINVPFRKHKKLEGIIIAIVFSTLGAMYFVSFQIAFTAAFFAMLVEAYLPQKKLKYLDDNLIIPLVAGGIMLLLV